MEFAEDGPDEFCGLRVHPSSEPAPSRCSRPERGLDLTRADDRKRGDADCRDASSLGLVVSKGRKWLEDEDVRVERGGKGIFGPARRRRHEDLLDRFLVSNEAIAGLEPVPSGRRPHLFLEAHAHPSERESVPGDQRFVVRMGRHRDLVAFAPQANAQRDERLHVPERARGHHHDVHGITLLRMVITSKRKWPPSLRCEGIAR